MKSILRTISVAGLIAVHFVCFLFFAAVLLPSSPDVSTADAGAAVAGVLTFSALHTLVLSHIILRSSIARRELVFPIFVINFGVMTVMPQIETAFFVRLPSGMLSRLFFFGAVFALVFSFFSVLILGRRNSQVNVANNFPPLNMPSSEWLAKLLVIVVAYLSLYFTFGYFIAWKSAAVRAYYGGTDPGSFLAQIKSVLNDTPLLVPLQIFRAFLWTAIAALVVRIMRARRWEVALAVALLFSVMSAQLLIPNPLMPSDVRMVHLVETASSNFVFGLFVVLVLCKNAPA